MSKEIHPLVQECMNLYGAKNVKELAQKVGIAYNTLYPWANGEPSALGKLLLSTLIENHHLREKDKAVKNLLSLYSIKNEE